MTEAEYYEAIRAFQHEDGPRLRLADWYSNSGDPRGEFIRLQIQRERSESPTTADSVEGSTLLYTNWAKEIDLLCEYQQSWIESLSTDVTRVTWHRGLPDRVVINELQAKNINRLLLENISPICLVPENDATVVALTKAEPIETVTGLDLSLCSAQHRSIRRIVTAPITRTITELVLSNVVLNTEIVGRLSANTSLPKLHSLEVAGCSLTPAHAQSLSVATFFSRLKKLIIANNPIGNTAVHALLSRLNPETIRNLDISNTAITPRIFQSLTKVSSLDSLESLDLSNTPLNEQSATLLAQSFAFPHLRSIAINGASINDHIFTQLVKAPWIQQLVSFSTSSNALTVASVAPMVSSLFNGSLKILCLAHNKLANDGLWELSMISPQSGPGFIDLSDNEFSSKGFELANQSTFTHKTVVLNMSQNHLYGCNNEQLLRWLESPCLGSLNLSQCGISNTTARALLNTRTLPNLTALNLSRNQLSDEALWAMGASPVLSQITSLDISQNAFTPEGIRIFAASPYLASLRSLCLRNVTIGASGVESLLQNRSLTKLRSLDLREADVPQNSVYALKQRFGDFTFFDATLPFFGYF